MTSDHRSVSQYNLFDLCPEAWRRKYQDGEWTPVGTAAKRGTAVDTAATATLQNMIDHGNTLPTEQVADIARDKLMAELADPSLVHLTEREQRHSFTKIKGDTLDTSVRMARYFNELIAPTIDPVAVQLRLMARIPGTDIDVLMFLDILESEASGNRIRDLKTKSRAPNKSDALNSLQLATYAWGARQELGINSRAQHLDVLTATKSKVSYHNIKGYHDEDSQMRCLGRFVEMEHAIEKQVFQPASPDSWKCSADYCGYYPTCSYGQGTAPAFFSMSVKQDELLQIADEEQIPDGPWSAEEATP
jgi:hypothetical protein